MEAGTTAVFLAVEAGTTAVFLAVELLPEPPFDEVLAVHEMTHLVHARRRGAPWPETVGTRAFAEGFAGAVSRRLVPGLPLDASLWFDAEHRDWLHDCERRRAEHCGLLGSELLAAEEEGERFFSAREDRAQGLPVRSAYWAGLLAADLVLTTDPTRAPRMLCGWGAPTATESLRAALEQVAAAQLT